MKTAIDLLEGRISDAMGRVTGERNCTAIVRPTADAKFGDYQANGVMALAKQLKQNPRQLAERLVEQLDVADLCEAPEIAGPGFINLRLRPDYVAGQLLRINADESRRLGIAAEARPQTVVVDFSSPNVAKQMHVGHLRSTIIGDAICRIMEFLGHAVIRQNHIGDWGTQFGMLIAYMLHARTALRMEDTFGEKPEDAVDVSALENTEKLYRSAKQEYDSDTEFAELSRRYVVALQKKESRVLERWKEIVNLSISECQQLYDGLGTTLTPENAKGESAYNDYLPDVVEDLTKAGLAVASDGAVCVFPEGFKNKEGQPLPFIIQKSDGAYLYATTDLAALRYRVNELKADRLVYVTDARQKLHFEMLFAVGRMAAWVGDGVELSHVMFGSVLGENGKPLKTRSGENVKLKDLLGEAVDRAKAVVEEKNPDLTAERKAEIARAVGIGAVKYADYSNNRTSDYVFSFEKMLAMDGNTAPYMQYAYARIKSIERRAESKGVNIEEERHNIAAVDLAAPAELELGKHLVRYGEAIESAASDYRPNYLTSYLYELAQKFSAFYTHCPVLDAPASQRPTRLLLCDLTAETIRHGLSELLGIAVVEQM